MCECVCVCACVQGWVSTRGYVRECVSTLPLSIWLFLKCLSPISRISCYFESRQMLVEFVWTLLKRCYTFDKLTDVFSQTAIFVMDWQVKVTVTSFLEHTLDISASIHPRNTHSPSDCLFCNWNVGFRLKTGRGLPATCLHTLKIQRKIVRFFFLFFSSDLCSTGKTSAIRKVEDWKLTLSPKLYAFSPAFFKQGFDKPVLTVLSIA